MIDIFFSVCGVLKFEIEFNDLKDCQNTERWTDRQIILQWEGDAVCLFIFRISSLNTGIIQSNTNWMNACSFIRSLTPTFLSAWFHHSFIHSFVCGINNLKIIHWMDDVDLHVVGNNQLPKSFALLRLIV